MPKAEIANMANPCPGSTPDPQGNGIVLRDMSVGDGTERQCCACNPGQRLKNICEEGNMTSTQCVECPAGGNADKYAHQDRTCSFEGTAQPDTNKIPPSPFHRLNGTTTDSSDVIDQLNNGNPIEWWMVAIGVLAIVALVAMVVVFIRYIYNKKRKCKSGTRTPRTIEDPPAGRQQPVYNPLPTGENTQRLEQQTKILDEAGVFFRNIEKYPSVQLTTGQVHTLAVNFLISQTRLGDLEKKHQHNTARFLFDVYQIIRERKGPSALDEIFEYLNENHLLVAQELDLALVAKVPGWQARYAINIVDECDRQR